jgi:HD-GYP domain-containing protein (c-di-GMP phosphodiesterase class II)
MGVNAETFDPALEEQLVDARTRQERDLDGREAAGRLAVLGLFLVGALSLAAFAPSHRHLDPRLFLGFVVAYAVLSSVHIEVGSGLALPTELVLVPMLFIVPANVVPLVVGSGLLVGALPDVVRGRLSAHRAIVLPGNALFSFGPAIVFLAAGEPAATWHGGAVLAGAVAAQFACDCAGASLLEWLALGVSPRKLVGPLIWTCSIDAMVAPFAYCVAVAERVQPGALLLPVPLLALLALFARERRQRLDSVLELSGAYRGTAFLLGDVVEADDEYTGDHSRQVVDLVVAVCDRIKLDTRERRLAEFTALLHDVGKIRIPSAIINKPGPLDPDERRIVNTHTIEGETLLQRVGGLLGDIGHLVRSCHERWDGTGYPDGLAGEEIPLVARIVCACDAFNAMTTDRAYRPALSVAAALEELRDQSGRQFDPAIVDAIVAVVPHPG